jgi:DNA repair protein RecO (recombination protein O)
MPLVKTAAVVLHAFKYGESSKIVRLATQEIGVQSAIAKGAMRPKSKFGARLQVLSEGVAQLYVKPNRELHTLAEFDVTRQHGELAHDVNRFATATALAELILRLAPAEPNPTVYEYLVDALELLARVPGDRVEPCALAVLWGAIGMLGFAPALDGCAHDGRRLPEGTASFSIPDGGLLCSACAAAQPNATKLEARDRDTLELLVSGTLDEIDRIPPRHVAAHRRLLARFAERHMSEDREFRALTLWETLPWRDM